MSLVRTHHNIYDTHYHIVFPVKYRKALLKDDIPLAISDIAREIGERYDIEFEKIGYDQDHIHLFTSFPPKWGGSDVVRIFKSITAKQPFFRFPELKKELCGVESSGPMVSIWPLSASGVTGPQSSGMLQTKERRWTASNDSYVYSLRTSLGSYLVGSAPR